MCSESARCDQKAGDPPLCIVQEPSLACFTFVKSLEDTTQFQIMKHLAKSVGEGGSTAMIFAYFKCIVLETM